jgi:hypothetical protein
MKRAAQLLGASIAVFTILIVYAMACYPGGTWADHHTHGYDPLHNFLCDLFEPVALDGTPNAASGPAIAAVLVIDAGLGLTWWLIPTLFASRRLGVAVRMLGIGSSVGILAVPLAPAKAWYWSHAAVVLFAGLLGLAAAVTSIVGLARAGNARALARLGTLLIAIVVIDVLLFIHQLIVVGNPSIWLSLLEVIATALLLVWLSLVAHRWSRA